MKNSLRLLPAGLGLLVAGCNILEPQVDPSRFYVLSTSMAAAPSANPAGPTLRVRPVELASYMRSRPLIVRKSENEVQFRDYARWGEPLELGIARVLREELLARGAAGAVQISGVRASNRPYDYELSVRVLSCEGMADGNVIFHAVWELFPAGDKGAPPVRGDFRPEGLKWDGKNETTLVADLSKAVSGLAGEIAAALKK